LEKTAASGVRLKGFAFSREASGGCCQARAAQDSACGRSQDGIFASKGWESGHGGEALAAFGTSIFAGGADRERWTRRKSLKTAASCARAKASSRSGLP